MPPDRYVEARDLWTDYNTRQRFEHDLLNRKTTWMLTTEGLLFAAVGIGDGPGELDGLNRTIAWSGLFLAVIVLIGACALIRSKWRSHKEYEAIFRRMELSGPPFSWGAGTWNTAVTLAPDIGVPVVFVVAWGCVLLQA
jgi:hypothetical protein